MGLWIVSRTMALAEMWAAFSRDPNEIIVRTGDSLNAGNCSAGGCDCGSQPCGEYLFDHRNGSMLREWFIDTFVGGPHGIDNPAIDGFFFDDNYGGGGASEEDPHNVEDCGLSESEKTAVAEGKCSRSLCVFFRSLKDAAAQAGR